MPFSRLTDLISTFSASELRRARQFLELPEVNRRADVQKLFEVLQKETNRKKLTEESKIFTRVYPDQPYDNQQLRLLRSYLLRALERFLVFQESQTDADTADPLLLRAYRQRGLRRHLEHELHRQHRAVEKCPDHHAETLLSDYLREREATTLLARDGRTKELNLQSVEDALDRAFWAYKLRQACYSRSHESVARQRYELRLLDEILEVSQNEIAPAVAIYRACYLALFRDGGEANFRQFRQLLTDQQAGFPHEEVRSLYLLALNYCIRRINENRTAFLREALDLYDAGLRSGALLDGERVSRFTLANATGIALRLGELDWTERLLDTYAPLLAPEWHSTTLAFNRARLAFARRNYDLAHQYLQQTDTSDPIDNVNARILQLKIYYETRELDLFDALLRSSERFVRRHGESYHAQLWRDILHFFGRLRTVNPHELREVEALKSELQEKKVLPEREWLLEQL